MALSSSGTNRVPPPPRDLNVQLFAEARAKELESLHTIVADRLNHDYRLHRSRRRRTTSHDIRIAKNKRGRKRRKLGGGGSETASGDGGKERKEEVEKKKLCRKMRRKIEFQENPVSGYVVSGDGTKRLRTHLWHAKRFTMVKRWGFFLPLGLHGRGRGSRAVLKWVKNGAVIHDASYCFPIQLEGPKDSLLAVLKMVLVPSPADVLEEVSRPVVCGVCCGSALLHQVGAPTSQLIAPVTYMWRPYSNTNTDTEFEKGYIRNGCGVDENENKSSVARQLWMWIHAAAFSEAFDALQSACFKQANESGISVSCLSLEGHLARFEVMGSKSLDVLQKLLHPLPDSCSSFSESVLGKCTHSSSCSMSQLQKSSVFEHAEHLPSNAVLSLDVYDPRDLHSRAVKPRFESHHDSDFQREIPDQIILSALCASDTSKERTLTLWMNPEQTGAFTADSTRLWDSRDKLNPPKKENLLCSEKHQRRMKLFYMDSTSDSTSDGNKEDGAESCPVLLVKHVNQRNNFTWWSIIAPISWAKAFWIPMASSGAHAIGLRERRWIACDNGLSSFPYDFPDCKAYSLSMALEAVASDQTAELRPPSVRPLRVPILPPWDCLRHSFEKGPSIMEDFQTTKLRLQPCVTDSSPTTSLADLGTGNCCSSSLEGSGLSSIGSVARTSDALIYHLKKISDSLLPLFPNTVTEKAAFSELIKERLRWFPKNTTHMPADRKLCFLRVLLHAFKEGIFEEGAVVCAPISGDISLRTSRQDEPETLQIPQSLIKSYFTERGCGQWELQVPEEASARQSFRWPIGFVTTGFVRGSSRPVAEAVCEASLLAQLRGHQWNQMQDKGRPEIFVLVRNLRSAAYRLALATVTLENQKDDLEFM